jgi:hypothetical protein
MTRRLAADNPRNAHTIGLQAAQFATAVGAIYVCVHILDSSDDLVVFTVVEGAVWISARGTDSALGTLVNE